MKATITVSLAASAFLAFATRAEEPVNTPPKTPFAAYLAVDYADTLQGVQAKLVVSSCARNEEPTANLAIHETMVASSEDIVVRVIGDDGQEISRYAGTAAVCQYARFAAAYFVRARHASVRSVQSPTRD